ncbi:uncharacterized protein ELE39_002756 [Cryptosporidium sp. chipmunk genotype I]|uniref:uncharacterized protein n=1 Tax=Cryptosporidium sp. chipmunk genotype I TaxID=1280935 RepID=UPI003519EAB8|nr:hypothetical protein ELE39_002756 [Cryptosporidium sp. chipmunk genotype I]
MTQVEELFTIDLEGEEVRHVSQAEENKFEYEFDKIGSEAEKYIQKMSDDEVRISICKSDIKSDGEIIEDEEDYKNANQNDKFQHQNVQDELDDTNFDTSKFELSNNKFIEKIKNFQDSELEGIVSLELWNLYKEMGPNIWPSFLRYENPPKHVKMLESRFYLNNKFGKSDQEVVFANIKDTYSSFNIDISEENYLSHINEVLKNLSEKKGFYSLIFGDEQNARDGLINLYLVTNGIKKSTNSGRCQFCGSSKCDRKAKNCKANRCFKCLLKGHQIKDCDTKYGYFNQQLLLPIRMERENVFTERNLIKNLFSFSKRRKFDIHVNNSKFCICLSCNQTGHINCSRQVPMFSKGSKIKDMISSTESRFLIFPEDSNSTAQSNKNQYLKTNIIIPSNKLFNISYLLEFTKSTRNQTNNQDKVVEIGQDSKSFFTARNNNFNLTNNMPYPQSQFQFHHPNQFNIQNQNISVQQQIPNQTYSYQNYNIQYQHFQGNLQLQTHAFHQNPIYRHSNQLHGQVYNYNQPVSNQINAEFASNQNTTIYSRPAVQTNRTTKTFNVKRKRFNCDSNFRGRKR